MKKVLYFLGELSDQDVDWMLETGSKEQVAAGSNLITEGQPIPALYIILSGTLEVSQLVNSKRHVIREIGCGEIVGEISFVEAGPPTATVTARTDAAVLSIQRGDLTKKLKEDAEFAARFYRSIALFLAHRLRNSVQTLGYDKKAAGKQTLQSEDELDANALDNVHMAGKRFDQVLQRLLGDG
jgi:bacteriocin-type transport-associated protein